MNTKKTYDIFKFTIAFIEDGSVNLSDCSRFIEVKEKSKFAKPENMEMALDSIKDEYSIDYYSGFNSIYRSCTRSIYVDNQHIRDLNFDKGYCL